MLTNIPSAGLAKSSSISVKSAFCYPKDGIISEGYWVNGRLRTLYHRRKAPLWYMRLNPYNVCKSRHYSTLLGKVKIMARKCF